MSIESKNNDNVSNLDALNDVSLDSLHNPQEPKTTQPITTGSVEPQQQMKIIILHLLMKMMK